jgi:tRNA-splicing ligase RtcB (3'-phosphate/5'-hydroxy nucleic acid ligase)
MSLEDVTSIENVKSWTSGVEVEWEAIKQLRNIAALPILAGHVAVMPDVHMGKGATVGSVIPTRGAIVPSAVGVDIGCGMCALRTNLTATDLPLSLASLRSSIESVVPVGFSAHDTVVDPKSDGVAGQKLARRSQELATRYESLKIMSLLGKHDHARTFRQMGTLGGGNHFIELCLDETDGVWIMLHSGSRNIGKTIGEAAIGMARDIAIQLDRQLADKDLAWLDQGTPEFDMYVEGLRWAQDYAAHNRALMLHAVLKVMNEGFAGSAGGVAVLDQAINCHHNYANVEDHFGEQVWITRKGAVSARAGELGIIPGSMGTRSYIVRGKGNADSYCSCSHGAGRRMSRGAAKRTFSLDDFAEQTRGVECRKDASVLDEIPGAYKTIEAVMAAQAELVEITHTLKQVMCIKG